MSRTARLATELAKAWADAEGVPAAARAPIAPGIHRGLSMAEYQAIDALGSTRLEWFATSPLHYRWMMDHPALAAEDTTATERGTALHMAVLEPELFDKTYCAEPNLELIGGAKPRATNAYKNACDELKKAGLHVLRADLMEQVRQMAASVRAHPMAASVMAKAAEREVTLIWEQGGRLCRGRADLLGALVIGDIKTTRILKRFNPYVVSDRSYYRQAGHYVNGAAQLGVPIEHFFFVAVEPDPPYDTGTFTLDPEALEFGRRECDELLAKLAMCEETRTWRGMFPALQHVFLGDLITPLRMEEASDG